MDNDDLALFSQYVGKRASRNTVSLYVNIVKAYLKWVEIECKQINDAQAYLDWLEEKGKSASTISTRAYAIQKYFKWKGITASTNCPTIKMGEPKYISKDKVSKMIESCSGVDRVLILVLFDSGVRISELLNLKVSDINLASMTMDVTRKGGRRDTVNIGEESIKGLMLLSEGKDSDDEIFSGMDYQYALKIVRKAGKQVGADVTPHTLRHSRAIQMLNDGAELWVVQQHLGHTSIATTANIYGRFKAKDLKNKIPKW